MAGCHDRHHCVVACEPLAAWKKLMKRAASVPLLGAWATLLWISPVPVPLGACHSASDDEDNACNSRPVRPLGWVWRHDGSAGARAKSCGLNCGAKADKSDDDSACSSRSVTPFEWLWRQLGLAAALPTIGRLK